MEWLRSFHARDARLGHAPPMRPGVWCEGIHAVRAAGGCVRSHRLPRRLDHTRRDGYVFPDGDGTALAALLQKFLQQPEMPAGLECNAPTRIQDCSTETSVRGILEALGMQRA